MLKGLLAEGIPLKEFRRIASAIAVAAQRTQDPDDLLELIRPALGGLIIQKLCGVREPLRVMTLEGQLEGILGQAMRADTQRRHVIEPDLGRRIVDALQRAAQPLVAEAKPFALVVQPAIRVAIRKLVRTCLPDTPGPLLLRGARGEGRSRWSPSSARQGSASRMSYQPPRSAFGDAQPR